MKKRTIAAIALSALIGLAGCGTSAPSTNTGAGTNANAFDATKDISVVTREEGSGTRSAFIELVGVELRNADGTREDKTTEEAITARATDVMMTNVASDKYAIGYISLGSLNSTIKALQVEGIDATAANVKNNTYPIQRPFNIVTKGAPAGLAQDFISYILSADGQKVISNGGYVAIAESAAAYAGSKPAGKIVVAGSSSVTPIMEKLKEAYLAINTQAQIEIQQSDSSAGINGTIEGSCDIGMSSRDLKEAEAAEVTGTQIALDGIAIIINKENPTTTLTKNQIKDIYTGTATKWDSIN